MCDLGLTRCTFSTLPWPAVCADCSVSLPRTFVLVLLPQWDAFVPSSGVGSLSFSIFCEKGWRGCDHTVSLGHLFFPRGLCHCGATAWEHGPLLWGVLRPPEFCFFVVRGLMFFPDYPKPLLETQWVDSFVSVSPGTYRNLSPCRFKSSLVSDTSLNATLPVLCVCHLPFQLHTCWHSFAIFVVYHHLSNPVNSSYVFFPRCLIFSFVFFFSAVILSCVPYNFTCIPVMFFIILLLLSGSQRRHFFRDVLTSFWNAWRPDHIFHIFTKVTLFVTSLSAFLPLPCLSSFFDYSSLRPVIFT